MEGSEMVKLEPGSQQAEEGEIYPCLENNSKGGPAPGEGSNNRSVLESEKTKRQENKYRVKLRAPERSKLEEWAMARTGLSRSGLLLHVALLFLLFVLLLTVIIMSCLWPSLPHSALFPVCHTSACLLASSEVLTKMNQSVNPCEDIREYSCGHWFNTHSLPPEKTHWGVKPHLRYKHREKLRDMIVTMSHPEELENIEWKIKNIYDSCMSLGTIETEDYQPLKKVITQLGGWRVLREFSLQTWDMKRTLRQLHAKYHIQPFFRVQVVPDAKQPQQSIIQISPGSLGLPDKSYYFKPQRVDDKVVTAYKRYLKDVAMTLGATSDDASTFSEDLFGFERRLAERFPSRVSDRVAQYRPTIAKLEEIAPSVPLFDILSAMFPEAKLTKKSEVVVIASDHLVNVSRIISSTDRSVLNDYMMWRLAAGYLPYLSKKFRNTFNEFNRQLYGAEEPSPRWEFCIETLQKFFGFGLEALLENVHPDHDRKRKVVDDVFQQIRAATKHAIQNSNNLPQHIQEHFLDKINSLDVQIGLPVSMRHSSYYNHYYRPLTSIKDDFFRNVLYGVNFNLEELQRRLTHPADEHRWMDVVSDGELKIEYVAEVNKVIVPISLLAMPFFHTHYPMSLLYGGLGVELGEAIMGSITGRGLLHDADGRLLDPDHPVNTVSHDCFLHHPLTTPYIEALRYTFKALSNVLSRTGHTHQPAMEHLEDQQIFFISHAQTLCTMKTHQRLELDLVLQSNPDDVSILLMLSSKLKEFSSTFHCTKLLRKETCDTLI